MTTTQPLYALLIAPDQKLRNDVLAGKKKITIRQGYKDCKPGPAMICCHLKPWAVMVDITSVRYCKLSELTEQEFTADGSKTIDEVLEKLRKYYPDLELSSPVTVISWDNVRGKLVDDYRARDVSED